MSNDRWREMEDGWREMDKLDPPPGWWKRSETGQTILGLLVILAMCAPVLIGIGLVMAGVIDLGAPDLYDGGPTDLQPCYSAHLRADC